MSQVRDEAARASGSSRPRNYVCPMHPEVVSNTADKCPKCGMKLVAANLVGQTPRHHDITNTPSMTTTTVTTAKATPTRRLKGSNGKTTCSRSTG